MAEKSFPLATPIKAHGKDGAVDLTAITLRPPKARQFFDYGMPFDNDGTLRPVSLRNWIVNLSGQGPDVVDELEMPELLAMANWIAEQCSRAGERGKG